MSGVQAVRGMDARVLELLKPFNRKYLVCYLQHDVVQFAHWTNLRECIALNSAGHDYTPHFEDVPESHVAAAKRTLLLKLMKDAGQHSGQGMVLCLAEPAHGCNMGDSIRMLFEAGVKFYSEQLAALQRHPAPAGPATASALGFAPGGGHVSIKHEVYPVAGNFGGGAAGAAGHVRHGPHPAAAGHVQAQPLRHGEVHKPAEVKLVDKVVATLTLDSEGRVVLALTVQHVPADPRSYRLDPRPSTDSKGGKLPTRPSYRLAGRMPSTNAAGPKPHPIKIDPAAETGAAAAVGAGGVAIMQDISSPDAFDAASILQFMRGGNSEQRQADPHTQQQQQQEQGRQHDEQQVSSANLLPQDNSGRGAEGLLKHVTPTSILHLVESPSRTIFSCKGEEFYTLFINIHQWLARKGVGQTCMTEFLLTDHNWIPARQSKGLPIAQVLPYTDGKTLKKSRVMLSDERIVGMEVLIAAAQQEYSGKPSSLADMHAMDLATNNNRPLSADQVGAGTAPRASIALARVAAYTGGHDLPDSQEPGSGGLAPNYEELIKGIVGLLSEDEKQLLLHDDVVPVCAGNAWNKICAVMVNFKAYAAKFASKNSKHNTSFFVQTDTNFQPIFIDGRPPRRVLGSQLVQKSDPAGSNKGGHGSWHERMTLGTDMLGFPEGTLMTKVLFKYRELTQRLATHGVHLQTTEESSKPEITSKVPNRTSPFHSAGLDSSAAGNDDSDSGSDSEEEDEDGVLEEGDVMDIDDDDDNAAMAMALYDPSGHAAGDEGGAGVASALHAFAGLKQEDLDLEDPKSIVAFTGRLPVYAGKGDKLYYAVMTNFHSYAPAFANGTQTAVASTFLRTNSEYEVISKEFISGPAVVKNSGKISKSAWHMNVYLGNTLFGLPRGSPMTNVLTLYKHHAKIGGRGSLRAYHANARPDKTAVGRGDLGYLKPSKRVKHGDSDDADTDNSPRQHHDAKRKHRAEDNTDDLQLPSSGLEDYDVEDSAVRRTAKRYKGGVIIQPPRSEDDDPHHYVSGPRSTGGAHSKRPQQGEQGKPARRVSEPKQGGGLPALKQVMAAWKTESAPPSPTRHTDQQGHNKHNPTHGVAAEDKPVPGNAAGLVAAPAPVARSEPAGPQLPELPFIPEGVSGSSVIVKHLMTPLGKCVGMLAPAGKRLMWEQYHNHYSLSQEATSNLVSLYGELKEALEDNDMEWATHVAKKLLRQDMVAAAAAAATAITAGNAQASGNAVSGGGVASTAGAAASQPAAAAPLSSGAVLPPVASDQHAAHGAAHNITATAAAPPAATAAAAPAGVLDYAAPQPPDAAADVYGAVTVQQQKQQQVLSDGAGQVSATATAPEPMEHTEV